ncbi:MAG: sugar phosphate isomerase/epimerase [Candidatus Ratteibacteria bacterium]|nr:sugar phosphate isomerase/epimerase [Candidatus Ratteibacteria bacterium]
MILSGFGDEISSDLNEQLSVMKQNGISHLEIRGVWNKNVLSLSDNEAEKVKNSLNAESFKISAIGSPIGKIGINDDFNEHINLFKRAIYLAKFFKTKYIRVFSYYIPKDASPADFKAEVMRRMKEKIALAKQENIVLLLENESGIYGNTPERCKEILETIASANLMLTFDPANFITEDVRPFKRAYPLLESYIEYMHIKDARRTAKGVEVTASGEGESEVKKILSALNKKGYKGFLSLEPHLQSAGKMSGFTGKERFSYACSALKKILYELGISYE